MGDLPAGADHQRAAKKRVMTAHQLLAKLEQALNLFKRVIDQTERRVLRKEKVSAGKKLVSFFVSVQRSAYSSQRMLKNQGVIPRWQFADFSLSLPDPLFLLKADC